MAIQKIVESEGHVSPEDKKLRKITQGQLDAMLEQGVKKFDNFDLSGMTITVKDAYSRLDEISFIGSTLVGASLPSSVKASMCNFNQASFDFRVKIKDSSLWNASFSEKAFEYGGSFENCDLQGVSFTKISKFGQWVGDSDGHSCKTVFEDCILQFCDLNANFKTWVEFSGTIDIRGADLQNISIDWSKVNDATFLYDASTIWNKDFLPDMVPALQLVEMTPEREEYLKKLTEEQYADIMGYAFMTDPNNNIYSHWRTYLESHPDIAELLNAMAEKEEPSIGYAKAFASIKKLTNDIKDENSDVRKKLDELLDKENEDKREESEDKAKKKELKIKFVVVPVLTAFSVLSFMGGSYGFGIYWAIFAGWWLFK